MDGQLSAGGRLVSASEDSPKATAISSMDRPVAVDKGCSSVTR